MDSDKTEQRVKYDVISTDNHVIEPPGTFVDRVPAALRDTAPRVVRHPEGGDGWTFDGQPPKVRFAWDAANGRRTPQEPAHSALLWEEIRPGNYDGNACIADMALDGVDAAVLYPWASIHLHSLADRTMAMACMSAYNDWLIDDYCAADRTRLFPLCHVPCHDGLDSLLREAERVFDKGAKGIYLPYYPDRPYCDPYYDPLWELVTSAGGVASLHRASGGNPPHGLPHIAGIEQRWLRTSELVQRCFSGIPPLTDMIFTGTFDRFPTLKFVDAEVNIGWIPFWVQQMEQDFELHREWARLPLQRSPREYVGENVFVATLDDYLGFRLASNDATLARTAMYSSDYMHAVTLWPESRRYIAELADGLDEATKQSILAGNAIRAFNLA